MAEQQTPHSLTEALPHIYIGPCHRLEADVDRFTHAIVAFPGPVPASVVSALPEGNILHVDVEDVDDAMIIEHFDASSRCIRGALQGEGSGVETASKGCPRIAVVCAQGASRSATLILAYMMQYTGMGGSAAQALASLRKVYPDACPNDGFMRQLELWREMGFKHDFNNEVYRSLKVRQVAQNAEALGVEFRSANRRDAEEQSPAEPPSTSVSYRCRSCRQALATSQNVMVDVSLGGEGFTWRKVKKNMSQLPADTSNSSIFVEPLPWMQGINDQAQGKIYCPNASCKARLGSFNWSGMQNEASQWITPAFQLHLSKMDASEPLAQAANFSNIGIRQPKFTGRDGSAVQNSPKKASCVIFDCDGVLVDSERASCEALRRSILDVTRFDIPHVFPQDFVPVFGMDVRSCLEYYQAAHNQHEVFARAAGVDENGSNDSNVRDWMELLARKVSDAKGSHYEAITKVGINPIGGAEVLMREACATVPTAIASSGSHPKIRHNLSSAGLWGIVPEQAIVSAQDVACGKPAPDVYLKALQVVGCQSTAKDAIVIEDSIHGMHAAIRAGVGHVAAMTTSLDEQQLLESLLALAAREGGEAAQNLPQESGSSRSGARTVIIGDTTCVVIGATLPTMDRLLELFDLN